MKSHRFPLTLLGLALAISFGSENQISHRKNRKGLLRQIY